MTFTIEHKITFPQLDVLNDIYRTNSLILEKVVKMNADIQAFVDDVNIKISAINSNLGRINADTTGLLAKVEQLQQSSTLSDEDKTALSGIRDGLANVVATTGSIDALVPDAQPPVDNGGGQV